MSFYVMQRLTPDAVACPANESFEANLGSVLSGGRVGLPSEDEARMPTLREADT